MTNYVNAIAKFAPNAEVSIIGDPTIYSNIVWGTNQTPIDQATIDAWVIANPGWDEPVLILTKYEFRKLYSMAERITIDSYQNNPNISAENKAILFTILKDLELSGEVQLYNPDVIAGVSFLEAVGLLPTGRAAEILSNTPPPG